MENLLTIEQTLLANKLFIHLAQSGTAATRLQERFVPDASARRVQEIAAIAKLMEAVSLEDAVECYEKPVTRTVGTYTEDIDHVTVVYQDMKASPVNPMNAAYPPIVDSGDYPPSREVKATGPTDYPSAINKVHYTSVMIPRFIAPDKVFTVPASTEKDADVFLELSGDYALISDLHIPYHNNKVIETCMNMSYQKGIKNLLILGDTWDGGQFHPKRGAYQHHGRTFQDDLILGGKIFKVLLECFEKITIFEGNHCKWFAQHLRGEIKSDWMMSKFFHEYPAITHSSMEQARITSGNKVIRAIHGANYSAANPLGVAQSMATKFEEGIVMGHQHHSCGGWSKSGKHQCVCLGGAFDQKKFDYVHNSPKTNPVMTNGFALLQNGYMTVVDDQSLFVRG
jgi:predicted phosphodiesterase